MGTGSRAMSASGPRPPPAPLPAVLAALFVFTSASVAAAQDVRRVLVLYPVSDGQPGILRFDESLRSAFKARPGIKVQIFNEYLDSARFPEERHQRLLAEFLRGKYSGKRPDVVITALAPSLDFVLKYRDEIFPGVPVVYGAVDRREVDARKLGPGVFGVPMSVELAPTLDLALRLHPGTRRVFVVAGRSKTDAYWVGEIPGDTALCLYRITQEALRNVIRHSGARHARVELRGSPDAVRLRVTDDGSGFDPASAAGSGGLGLISMRERLRLVDGEIAVDARPSGGARIEVRTPLVAPAEVGCRDDGLEEGASNRQSDGVS